VSDLERLRARALELAKANNFDAEAERINREILVAVPADTKAMTRVARCLIKRNAIVEACLIYEAVLAIEPRNDIARNGLTKYRPKEPDVAELNERIATVLAPHQALVDRVKTIPGVKQRSAEALIAECGMNMSHLPSQSHLASWAGICPGNHESGGKRKSGRMRRGSKWLRTALTEAAQGAARARGTYLSAHFSQIMGRRGRPKAVGAARHDILVAYYFIVRDGVTYRDLGADWAAKRFFRRASPTSSRQTTRDVGTEGNGGAGTSRITGIHISPAAFFAKENRPTR
jgi:hypothetical protein